MGSNYCCIRRNITTASVGIKLPGIEYDVQKEEAAYRKKLVLGEDFKEGARPKKITDLYGGVRKIHYKMYFHYLYFNAVKWSYLQGMVIVPYVALAPTILQEQLLWVLFNKLSERLVGLKHLFIPC